MARRRRRYGSMVQIPGLGSVMANRSVSSKDVALGAAAGMVGTLVLKGAGNKLLGGNAPDWLLKGSPFVGGLLTGVLLHLIGKGSQASKGQAFGAVLAGTAIQGWDVAKTSFPSGLGDVVSLKLGDPRLGRYAGRGMGSVIVDENTPAVGPGGAAYAGLIVDEGGRSLSGTNANLAQLAAWSMGTDESSGIEELMDLD